MLPFHLLTSKQHGSVKKHWTQIDRHRFSEKKYGVESRKNTLLSILDEIVKGSPVVFNVCVKCFNMLEGAINIYQWSFIWILY